MLFGEVFALEGLREALLVDTYQVSETLSFAALICAAIDGGLYMLFRFTMSITGRLQERDTLAWVAKAAFFWLLGLSLVFAILSVVALSFDSQVLPHNKILEKCFEWSLRS